MNLITKGVKELVLMYQERCGQISRLNSEKTGNFYKFSSVFLLVPPKKLVFPPINPKQAGIFGI